MGKNKFQKRLASSKFVVLGAGISGIAAAKLLKSKGTDVVVADQSDKGKRQGTVEQLDLLDIPSFWGDLAVDCLTDDVSYLILSPGISRANPCVTEALSRGIKVIAEVELASWFIRPGDKLIGITGTNGKTTTTAWIAHILKGDGLDVCCGGNIGDAWSALIPDLPNRPVCHVIELSSYQLESIDTMKPNVAMITNLTPDHLDRYGTMEAYRDAKRRITMNMAEGDVFLLNSSISEGCEATNAVPVRYSVACINAQAGAQGVGAGVDESGNLYIVFQGKHELLLHADELPIPGLHNVENALFAALAARLAGASHDGVVLGLRTFCAVEHRIELCGIWNDISFYNDSKATNVDSLAKALTSFPTKKVVLIAGGVHKKAPYTPLCDMVRKGTRAVITIGDAASIIEADWADCGVPMKRADSMRSAVLEAVSFAKPGDVVMLSPACASFDWYPMPGGGFETRGRDFKNIVAELIAEKKASQSL